MTGSVFNSLFLQEKVLVSKDRLIMIIWSGTFVFIGCVPIYFLDSHTRWIIYIISFIYGIGFSIGISTATSLINDVVGSKGKHGAFVYGFYSLIDKMSVGIVLFIFSKYVIEDELILKMTTAYLPPISMFFAFLMALFVRKFKNNKQEVIINDSKYSKSVIDDDTFTFISLK